VDLNPVRAGIVARPEDYRWSSYRSRIGLDPCDWLDSDAAFLALAGSPEARQHRYREFVEQGVAPHELELIRRAIQRNELTGSSEFRKQMEARTGLRAQRRPRGRPKKENKSDPIFSRRLFPD
jgi:putative transposase